MLVECGYCYGSGGGGPDQGCMNCSGGMVEDDDLQGCENCGEPTEDVLCEDCCPVCSYCLGRLSGEETQLCEDCSCSDGE